MPVPISYFACATVEPIEGVGNKVAKSAWAGSGGAELIRLAGCPFVG